MSSFMEISQVVLRLLGNMVTQTSPAPVVRLTILTISSDSPGFLVLSGVAKMSGV
jgi:hypothetical protein